MTNNEVLRAAVRSGALGHGWVMGQHYIDFRNGHIERITERESLLVEAGYEQAQRHAREER